MSYIYVCVKDNEYGCWNKFPIDLSIIIGGEKKKKVEKFLGFFPNG